jgi:hypothetical protein
MRDEANRKYLLVITQEDIMNKLVLAFAAVAAFGLSTAAFAENPAVSTSITSTQNQAAPSHRAGAKVVRHHTLHRRVSHARHYGNDRGKRVTVKHLPAKKTVTTKTAS